MELRQIRIIHVKFFMQCKLFPLACKERHNFSMNYESLECELLDCVSWTSTTLSLMRHSMEQNKQLILRNKKTKMEQYLFILEKVGAHNCTMNSSLRTLFLKNLKEADRTDFIIMKCPLLHTILSLTSASGTY